MGGTSKKLSDSRTIVLVALGLCAARITLVLMVNAYVHHWDTYSYVAAAHKPLMGLFLDPWRSATYPLALKLLGYHEPALIVLQSMLASGSWLFFAFTLANIFRDRRGRLIALFGFYLLSFSIPIIQWDYILYAESLSLSLFALVASFLLRYVLTGNSAELRWLAALAVPFVLARDSNLFAYGMVAALAILTGIPRFSFVGETPQRPMPRARRHLQTLVLISIALLPIASVALGTRGSTSIQNVILKAVVKQPALVDELAARYGMPRSVVKCAGQDWWRYDGPCIEEIDSWVTSAGRGWYLRFLLAHPGFTGRMVIHSWVPALGDDKVTQYGDFEQIRQEHLRQPKVDVIPLTPNRRSYYEPSRTIARVFYRASFSGILAVLRPPFALALSFLPFGVLVFLMIRPRSTQHDAPSLLPAVFLALVAISQLPVVILSINAVPRHALLASVATSYLALYLVFFLVSLILRKSPVT